MKEQGVGNRLNRHLVGSAHQKASGFPGTMVWNRKPIHFEHLIVVRSDSQPLLFRTHFLYKFAKQKVYVTNM